MKINNKPKKVLRVAFRQPYRSCHMYSSTDGQLQFSECYYDFFLWLETLDCSTLFTSGRNEMCNLLYRNLIYFVCSYSGSIVKLYLISLWAKMSILVKYPIARSSHFSNLSWRSSCQMHTYLSSIASQEKCLTRCIK